MPAPDSVPVPGLPLEATVPASPPIMPVLVPFLVTSSAVPGAMTGADEVGVEVLAAGVLAGAVVVVAGVVVVVLRSLQAPKYATATAANTGIAICIEERAAHLGLVIVFPPCQCDSTAFVCTPSFKRLSYNCLAAP